MLEYFWSLFFIRGYSKMSMINEKSAESALLDIEESEVLKTVESVTENDELFRIDEDCEANISEIFSETITKIQSAERDLKRKYEKLQEMKDQVLEGGKELEAKIQVIVKSMNEFLFKLTITCIIFYISKSLTILN